MDATCKTCPYYAEYAYTGPSTGTCRRHPPQPMMTESGGDHPELSHENPEVPETWFCGEHPLRQRDRLAAMAMQALIPMAPEHAMDADDVANDAYRYADALLAASRPVPGKEPTMVPARDGKGDDRG